MSFWFNACPWKLSPRSPCQNPIPASVRPLSGRSGCWGRLLWSLTSAAEEHSSVTGDSNTWGSQNGDPSHLPSWGGWRGAVSEVPVCSTTLLPTLAADRAAPSLPPVPHHLLGGPANKVPARESTQVLWNPNLSPVLIVSLRYSLYTMKFTCFKYTTQ